jgi:D-3-phosphoglycerate dehydrogenase / 2-oxoglutarate reductase
MSIKILANDGIDAAGRKILTEANCLVISDKVPQEQLAEAIQKEGYTVLTVRSATQVRKELIDACPGLKIIGRGGVGMDNIDVEYARSKGITVINTPAASSHSVAELVFAHFMGAARFLYDANRNMPVKGLSDFNALKKNYAAGTELKGKTLGIIGLGRIGRAAASIGLGLGMKVRAFDPEVLTAEIPVEIQGISPVPKVEIKTESLESVLAQADFLTIHVPGGQILGSDDFSKLKKGVILANTARGGVVDEGGLIQALNDGIVAHACLDVFVNEPKPVQEILSHPKISLTPHIGASTEEAQERIGIELAEKILEALK